MPGSPGVTVGACSSSDSLPTCARGRDASIPRAPRSGYTQVDWRRHTTPCAADARRRSSECSFGARDGQFIACDRLIEPRNSRAFGAQLRDAIPSSPGEQNGESGAVVAFSIVNEPARPWPIAAADESASTRGEAAAPGEGCRMRVRNAVLITIALVAVFVVGSIIGTTIYDRRARMEAPAATVATPAAEPAATAPAKPARRSPRAKSPSRTAMTSSRRKRPPTRFRPSPSRCGSQSCANA